eukprot:TRINITY_DN1277_c0_g1_i1.p1 TRINITY_DN1277_c0_g1~~TRINITY_DN1277_c0_g1_i1.p1  ORF type:complete len:192 (-),score=42.49 TRINITY_DN1277_c0_g1_i1:103-678(-)
MFSRARAFVALLGFGVAVQGSEESACSSGTCLESGPEEEVAAMGVSLLQYRKDKEHETPKAHCCNKGGCTDFDPDTQQCCGGVVSGEGNSTFTGTSSKVCSKTECCSKPGPGGMVVGGMQCEVCPEPALTAKCCNKGGCTDFDPKTQQCCGGVENGESNQFNGVSTHVCALTECCSSQGMQVGGIKCIPCQ